MYTTQHSFPTESSSQLLTEIHDLKKKRLNYSKKTNKQFLSKINFSSLASNTQCSPLHEIKTKGSMTLLSLNHPPPLCPHVASLKRMASTQRVLYFLTTHPKWASPPLL